MGFTYKENGSDPRYFPFSTYEQRKNQQITQIQ